MAEAACMKQNPVPFISRTTAVFYIQFLSTKQGGGKEIAMNLMKQSFSLAFLIHQSESFIVYFRAVLHFSCKAKRVLGSCKLKAAASFPGITQLMGKMCLVYEIAVRCSMQT